MQHEELPCRRDGGEDKPCDDERQQGQPAEAAGRVFLMRDIARRNLGLLDLGTIGIRFVVAIVRDHGRV